MKVLVVGASGLIGRRLVEVLRERRDEAVVTGRDSRRLEAAFRGAASAIAWDPNAGPMPPSALDGVDAVVNLAGEPVNQRWTAARKERILASRVLATRNTVTSIAAAARKPQVLVNVSAIGWYGDGGHRALQEDAARAKDFLAEVCGAWEAEAEKARAHCRVAIARVGVVLSKEGGAYPVMSRPFRLFVGGKIGLGYRWLSWIHIDDVVGAMLHLIDTKSAEGAFNLTAPNPVSNAEFTSTLAGVLRRPAFLPVPPLALKILLGGFATVALSSQRVLPLRTLASGYRFKFPTLRPALEELR